MITVKELKDKALDYFGLTTAEQADAKANRAYEAGTFDSLSGNDDPQSGTTSAGGFGYKSIGKKGKRDFTAMTHDQVINTVWASYQSNGIAERATEFRMAAILGRDTSPETSDEDLQKILDQFWKRNLSNNHNLKRFIIAHSLFGELILPVFVRESDGRVLLGYIDQGDVEENGVIFHPENNLERWAVILKKETDGRQKCYRIIREDEGTVYADEVIPPRHPEKLVIWQDAVIEDWEIKFLKEKGLTEYTGSCFYFDKNNLANQPRGFSDLLQSVDWLDANDEVLFSLVEREQFANYFSWLVKLDNKDESKVKERASELNTKPPTGKGQINVHSNEDWSFVSTDLKQPASIAVAQATKKQAIEGLNQSEVWHNEMDTSNRATAETADNPTNRHLQHEQADMVQWLMFMLQFVADQAEISGFYRPEEDNEIGVQVPEIVKGDVVEISNAFGQTVNALVVAMMDLKVITRDTVAQVVSKIVAEYGVQYNPAEELLEIDNQVEEIAVKSQSDIDQFLVDTIERNGSN